MSYHLDTLEWEVYEYKNKKKFNRVGILKKVIIIENAFPLTGMLLYKLYGPMLKLATIECNEGSINKKELSSQISNIEQEDLQAPCR